MEVRRKARRVIPRRRALISQRSRARRRASRTAADGTGGSYSPFETAFVGWVDPKSVFGPYAGATVPGLLTFRGNPTRNYYGQGPVPAAPHVLWQYPGKKMCSDSEDRGETTQWCGNGWTGEPAV